MKKINLTGELTEVRNGLEYVKDMIGFEEAKDGILLTVKKGDRLYAKFDGTKGEISYTIKVSFFRMLTLFLKNLNSGKPFEINEEIQFDFCNIMLDVSRNGVIKVENLKKFVQYSALMGLNGFALYMEDVYEVPGRPYFGYMRGRYTYEELKELDDFAYELGVEVFPVIEALAHMEQYLKYAEARSVRDTQDVLLAESEETYEFIELLIQTVIKPFRSKRIGLCMDEAQNLGLGNYINKFGYKPKTEIFLNHLNRVAKIAEKYGLIVQTEGDMFFRLASKNHRYYDKDIEFTDDILKLVPKNISFKLWYYEGYNIDNLVEFLFEKQVQLGENFSFGGSCWNYTGFLCEQKFGLDNAKVCLPLCKEYGAKWVCCHMFGDDGTECDAFYILPTTFAYGEHMYNKTVTDEQIKEMYEFVTGGNFDAFIRMSDFHVDLERVENIYDLTYKVVGKRVYWQDILTGLMDEYLFNIPMSDYYKKLAEDLSVYKDEKWNTYYRFAEYICDTLALKCEIAENLQKAYLNDDKEYLTKVVSEKLPALSEKVKRQHKMHKQMWYDTYKPFGFECIEIRYAGLVARIETAMERISDYLKGNVTKLDELEQKRLPHNIDSKVKCYDRMYTASTR